MQNFCIGSRAAGNRARAAASGNHVTGKDAPSQLRDESRAVSITAAQQWNRSP
jgi:hypothetical protein